MMSGAVARPSGEAETRPLGRVHDEPGTLPDGRVSALRYSRATVPISQPALTDANILFNNSFVLRSRCQRQTTTRSCSGSTQIVFEPAPSAAKLVRGASGHCLPWVFSHQRYP